MRILILLFTVGVVQAQQLKIDLDQITNSNPMMYMDLENSYMGINTLSPTSTLTVNGTVTATSLVESSSIRYKENIDLFTDTDILDKLIPVTYTLIETNSKDIGFIAEEVDKVYPTLVVYNKYGEPEALKYTKFIPILVKKVQELDKKIKELEAKIEKWQR